MRGEEEEEEKEEEEEEEEEKEKAHPSIFSFTKLRSLSSPILLPTQLTSTKLTSFGNP